MHSHRVNSKMGTIRLLLYVQRQQPKKKKLYFSNIISNFPAEFGDVMWNSLGVTFFPTAVQRGSQYCMEII